MDAETRDRVLMALGLVETRHPAKPPHVQSSHGRKGAKGLAKAAVKKARDRLADALDIADGGLPAVAKMQGFDSPPRVATAAEVDAAVAKGWTETWRGVRGTAAAGINDAFRTGDYQPGVGLFGKGFYFSADRRVGEAYRGAELKFDRDYEIVGYSGGDQGGLLRAAVSPDASLVTFDELASQMKTERGRHGSLTAAQERLLADPGAFAAARGYDVIRVEGRADGVHMDNYPDQYVVLNRSALMVQRGEDEP